MTGTIWLPYVSHAKQRNVYPCSFHHYNNMSKEPPHSRKAHRNTKRKKKKNNEKTTQYLASSLESTQCLESHAGLGFELCSVHSQHQHSQAPSLQLTPSHAEHPVYSHFKGCQAFLQKMFSFLMFLYYPGLVCIGKSFWFVHFTIPCFPLGDQYTSY